MSDVLLTAEGISKKFCKSLKYSMLYGMQDIGKTVVGISPRTDTLKKKEFWALDDISFELKRGECLGLIGRNGSGKSTMLKLLNGIIAPDKGRVKIKGRVGALIEVGAGFHPMLTGRENIFINGTILGFSKKELKDKFDEIVDFAELSEFIDTPVKNYSSGMRVRLGFSIAAQMRPDVLLIDEVLAVGDMGFKLKCYNLIDSIRKETAVIFVSHAMPQISRICDKILLLDKGRIELISDTVSEGIDQYYSKFKREIPNFEKTDEAELLSIKFLDHDASKTEKYKLHRLNDLKIELAVKIHRRITTPYISIVIDDKEERPIGICYTDNGVPDSKIYDQDKNFNYYKTTVTIPRVSLSKGIYSITFILLGGFRERPLLRLQSIKEFQVISKNDVWQPIEFESVWT